MTTADGRTTNTRPDSRSPRCYHIRPGGLEYRREPATAKNVPGRLFGRFSSPATGLKQGVREVADAAAGLPKKDLSRGRFPPISQKRIIFRNRLLKLPGRAGLLACPLVVIRRVRKPVLLLCVRYLPCGLPVGRASDARTAPFGAEPIDRGLSGCLLIPKPRGVRKCPASTGGLSTDGRAVLSGFLATPVARAVESKCRRLDKVAACGRRSTIMWEAGWVAGLLIGASVIGVAVLLAAVLWRPLRNRKREAQLARARQEFHRQRERLEAKFLQLAGRSGKPRGLEWTNCDFENEVVYAGPFRPESCRPSWA